ncbi:MAG: DUF6524 family protein [Chromatiaceae bacterium]|jgi:hypothetical protein|nr:DUF6524 family protein [Chromatiaceae bacterium]
MAAKSFTFMSFLARLIGAMVLVFATYNPSGYSYFHWVKDSMHDFGPLVAFAGVVLLIGWVMFLRATARSLGMLGILLAAGFFGTLLWLVIDRGWLDADNLKVITYLVLVLLSAILATGMSWSHIRRKLTGQIDVDDVEDNG